MKKKNIVYRKYINHLNQYHRQHQCHTHRYLPLPYLPPSQSRMVIIKKWKWKWKAKKKKKNRIWRVKSIRKIKGEKAKLKKEKMKMWKIR
jgi:hypothetical protein